MNLFPLTIFPEGGLAGSIITTVWVGVFVMCFFNLRFGWVLSGLVVPGYLVPLLIVKPFAAAVITVEAVLAYLIVYLFSEKLAPGRFPSLFGRDRFMGLILASIAVRLALDGYVLPELSVWLEDNFDRRIDWEDNLQSFGLVVISLMANQFWKPGLGRGLLMAIVTIGLTFLIVRYGLMEVTNFRISGVYYIYESLATSVLASPKAYIILTLTALIASHYNVKYGWDFSGILIPSLIALQWYEPTKILTSFGEAIIIYCVARFILKLPFMANVTLEGGRKLLLFFNISFAWKMALGWFVIWQGLDLKTSDFFGFGYLLSTLIAIKAHDKDIFPRLARSTLQVSLAGAVLGNFVGFSLSAATARAPWNADRGQAENSQAEASRQDTPELNALLVNAVGDSHIRKMRPAEIAIEEKHSEALARLVEMLEQGAPAAPPGYDQRISGWQIKQIENGHLAIIRDDDNGAELLIFNPAAIGNEAVILPDPTSAPGLASAAVAIQRSQDARWLVIGAPDLDTQLGTQIVASDIVSVFMQTTRATHIIIGASQQDQEGSQVSASGRALASLDVTALRETLPDLSVVLAEEVISEGNAHAAINLSPSSIQHIARRKAQFANLLQPNACTLSRHPESAGRWNTLRELAYARFEIAEPMIARVREGLAPYTAGAAARIGGMELRRCRFGPKLHWSLSSGVRDEGNIFLAEGEAPQKTVLTFENSRGVLPTRIGAAVHAEWDSNALFVATRSDSFLRDPRSVFDVTWQAWVRSQEGLENPMAFQLRVRPAMAKNYRRSVDVVVAKDRIGSDLSEFDSLTSALRASGLRAETVENTSEQAGMEARPGMSLRFLDSVGERRFALGWLMFSGLSEQRTSHDRDAAADDGSDGNGDKGASK